MANRFTCTSGSTGNRRSHLVNWASIKPPATLLQ